ncbi:MAG TPA: M56 family metallopeptidase [Bryobacteraceae bacterium]|jgi:TonB family protein
MTPAILKLLVNAAWQIPLAGAFGWCAGRMLRGWSSAWSVWAWRMSLALAALLPVATAVWTRPLGAATIQIPVSVTASPAQATSTSIPWIAIAYLLFTTFHALRLLWRWFRLRDLNPDTVSAPVVFGWLRPRLILPRVFAESASELARRAAVVHETAHVRHRDYVLNLIIEIMTLPVAFHPLLIWMKRRAASAVEMRCDEDAAREFDDPAQYALGLIEAARVLGSFPSPHLTTAFVDPNTFEERIVNLTIPKSQPRRALRLTAVAAIAAAGLLVTGVSVSYAAQASDEKVHDIHEKGVTPPKVLHKIQPDYTENARAAKIQGSVVLAVEIATNGRAENVRVERSLDESLDQSAVEAVKKWEFRPADKDGQPVRVSAHIEVNFHLKNDGHDKIKLP